MRPYIVLLLLASILSGCVAGSGAGPKTEAPVAGEPTFDEDTGAIQGTILDDENVPVPGAMVALIGVPDAGHSTVSDAAGNFVLENVPAGEYTMAAQALGYESAAKKVSVAVGEVTQAHFVLARIQVNQAYMHTFNLKGFFACSWTFVITTGPCFYPVTGTNTSIVPVDPWSNNKRQFDYQVGPGAMTVYNEMTWTRTAAATGDKMSVFLSYNKRTGQHWYCNGAGPNPVAIRWDRAEDSTSDKEAGTCTNGGAQLPSAEPQTIPMEGQVLTTRANTGPSNYDPGLMVGLAFQQDFEMYMSMFYWEHAPEQYSALPDQ